MTGLKKKDPTLDEKEFLLGAHTSKLYFAKEVMAGRWDYTKQTFIVKQKELIPAIVAQRGEHIKSDSTDFPEGEIFLLTVDGVRFLIQEPRATNPGSQ